MAKKKIESASEKPAEAKSAKPAEKKTTAPAAPAKAAAPKAPAKAKKAAKPQPATSSPMIDTGLAAENAARMVMAGTRGGSQLPSSACLNFPNRASRNGFHAAPNVVPSENRAAAAAR